MLNFYSISISAAYYAAYYAQYAQYAGAQQMAAGMPVSSRYFSAISYLTLQLLCIWPLLTVFQYFTFLPLQASTAPTSNGNSQTGQPQQDYSAQWAEYYRAYGMHKEAEMIEQMAKQMREQSGQVS